MHAAASLLGQPQIPGAQVEHPGGNYALDDFRDSRAGVAFGLQSCGGRKPDPLAASGGAGCPDRQLSPTPASSVKHTVQPRGGTRHRRRLLAPQGRTKGVVNLLKECWWRMEFMQAAFEREQQLGDGAESRQRSEDRRRDEEAWSRMDDEGCPNDHGLISARMLSEMGEGGAAPRLLPCP